MSMYSIPNDKQHRLTLPFISVRMRILYAVIALCTISACIIMQIEQQTVPLAGYIITGIALLVACFTSYWEIDCQTGIIHSVNGVLWLKIRRAYPQTAIEKVEREAFTQGFLKRPFVKYSFYTKAGIRYVMGIVPQRTADAIDRQWEYITAAFTAAESLKE